MRVSFILDSIDHGTVVLPEFQRGYVWSREQVKGLIQSMYRRYPVGGLLIWNTRADATELRGSDASGSDTVKLLLDGQQRVTSLYGVIRGRPPQFFEDPEKARAFTGLYFHVGREVFEFYRPTVMADDPLWVSVTDLMVDGPDAVSFGEEEDIDRRQLVLYVNRLQRLHGIRDIDLHDENISGDDMTVDVVVDIFNRVNSGGTKLSKGDLALARLCALRPEARNELRAAVERWEKAGFNFTLDWFLRCINVVVTGEARFEALKNVSTEDFGIGLKKAEQAIDFVLNLISSRLGLDHDRVLMGRYGIPAMVRVVVDAGGSLTDAESQNRLLYWYVHQSAWGRYSSSTESVIDRDLAAIEQGGIDALIRELEIWRGSLTIRPDDFDAQTVGSRFYPMLYMLTRVNEAKDLRTGIPLSAHLLGKRSRLEVHHLFPKAILYRAGYSRSEVNAVANYVFLTGESNRSLSATPPDAYLPEVGANHGEVLASQWIPQDPDLWDVDRYLDFLAARRVLLADAANRFLDGLLGGVGPTELEPVEVTLEASADTSALDEVTAWCHDVGVAAPEVAVELHEPETGRVVYADAAWPDGVQVGRSEPVALVLERDGETEALLGALGYRYFTDTDAFRHYVEHLIGMDLENDGATVSEGLA